MNNKYKCLFSLYEECVVIANSKSDKLKKMYEENTDEFISSVCTLCIKSFRLKKGLGFIHEYRGQRTGVTL
ncbi:MAG: hypothetical protein C0179_05455 [Fervidicoccus sp.]|nr:MAG: hypothetical protein C0179_05455 [Fervidicoccus sp.]